MIIINIITRGRLGGAGAEVVGGDVELVELGGCLGRRSQVASIEQCAV